VSAREVVVRCAREQLNDEYEWAQAGPDKFDCSGLLAYCYGQAGIALSRSSHEQARAGMSIPRAQAQPGDILIYGNGSHVGLVTGDNEAIHALNEHLDIRVTKIDGANIGLPLTDVRSVIRLDSPEPTPTPEPPPNPKPGRDRDRQRQREKDRLRRRRRKA
jgi:cell wall-associated NlpC family hydrolase